MPIRFRCVYCDKLLGIARRKAGTIINCPHCAEKLIVPTPDPADTAAEPEEDLFTGSTSEKALAGPAPPLFERLDFEAMLQGTPVSRPRGEPDFEPHERQEVRTESGPGYSPLYSGPSTPASPSAHAPRIEPASARPRGFYVSPAKATLLTLLMLVLLALAFGAGWMLRRSMSMAPSKPPAARRLGAAGKTAQDFFEGVMHGQWSAAYETLDPESRAWCTENEFTNRAKTYLNTLGFAPTEAKITANENGDDATAVAVYHGPNSKHFKDGASLRRTAGGWRVILRKNFGQSPETTP